jgi:hypothetical protein
MWLEVKQSYRIRTPPERRLQVVLPAPQEKLQPVLSAMSFLFFRIGCIEKTRSCGWTSVDVPAVRNVRRKCPALDVPGGKSSLVVQRLLIGGDWPTSQGLSVKNTATSYKVHFFSPTCQLTQTVIGASSTSSGRELIRKRRPSVATLYGEDATMRLKPKTRV